MSPIVQALLLTTLTAPGQPSRTLPVEALIYTTLPSVAAHRPVYAMDGDAQTSYKSVGGMDDGDSFTVLLSRPIRVRSIHITTGANGDDLLTDAFLETSADGKTYVKRASFGADGIATARRIRGSIEAIRIRMNPNRNAQHLVVDEIAIDSPVPVGRVMAGPPRGFVDTSLAPDCAAWAADAEKKMEAFWPDTDSLLYTDGFIPPNAIHVIYRTGPDVTPVAATGGGVMTVNADYCRHHADDTGLVVHEAAHVVQSGGSPGWLIEAIADYIRWIKFEPENFTYGINPKTATPHDPYRTGAAFLGWCELHYDGKLVTKLNEATRFGRYKDALFLQYCGKPIDALWKEFISAYQADKPNLLKRPTPPAMRPRAALPAPGALSSASLTFDKLGIVADGKTFSSDAGFDDGGAAFSGTLLNGPVSALGITFSIGAPGVRDVMAADGQTLALAGSHKQVWILAAAIDGAQHDQTLLASYADGSTTTFYQNFSDWFQPEDFPGEIRAVRMPYRNLSDGSRDARTFYVFAYGFPLDGTKAFKSLTLPVNDNIRILGVTFAD